MILSKYIFLVLDTNRALTPKVNRIGIERSSSKAAMSKLDLNSFPCPASRTAMQLAAKSRCFKSSKETSAFIWNFGVRSVKDKCLRAARTGAKMAVAELDHGLLLHHIIYFIV